MKDGITIIIPCYNVEKYIEKCLDSISKQNIGKHEIILVDDCSTDNTVNIIDKYINNHQKVDITLIKNNENSGAGISRNKALKKAKYDIISFIDSDDYIEDNFYESMINRMNKTKSDIVVCDIYIRENGFSNRSCACDGKKEKINFISNILAASPCNKLIKKELLLKYPFGEGIVYEDIPSIISCLTYANKIAYVPNTYYNYVQHKSSVQNKSFSEKKFDIFKAINILNDRIKNSDNYNEIWNVVIYQQIIMFFIFVIPKEKKCFKRAKYLKKFYKLSKNLEIRKNNLLWDFLQSQTKKRRYYYKLLLKLNDNGFSLLTSIIIKLYSDYQTIKNK